MRRLFGLRTEKEYKELADKYAQLSRRYESCLAEQKEVEETLARLRTTTEYDEMQETVSKLKRNMYWNRWYANRGY